MFADCEGFDRVQTIQIVLHFMYYIIMWVIH